LRDPRRGHQDGITSGRTLGEAAGTDEILAQALSLQHKGIPRLETTVERKSQTQQTRTERGAKMTVKSLFAVAFIIVGVAAFLFLCVKFGFAI
jgi:hypothetical protein